MHLTPLRRRLQSMNNVSDAIKSFDGLSPWSGNVPSGYLADFLGVMIDLRFREVLGVVPSEHGGDYQQHQLPTPATYGEGFFEVLQWVQTARAARDRYVMVSLGACYGLQAVGCYKALQAINPMPAKLVMVEPEPGNVAWIYKHLKDNEIDPEDHWIMPMAISNDHSPAFFPVGSPGTGTHSFISTNHPEERKNMLALTLRDGKSDQVLENLFLRNRTGIVRDVTGGQGLFGEVEYVSCLTLQDVLSPFDLVDYVEADLQGSESFVFPPFLETLARKVKRIHMGTHSEQIHQTMEALFRDAGWEVLFSFAPFQVHHTDAGSFKADDGILTSA